MAETTQGSHSEVAHRSPYTPSLLRTSKLCWVPISVGSDLCWFDMLFYHKAFMRGFMEALVCWSLTLSK